MRENSLRCFSFWFSQSVTSPATRNAARCIPYSEVQKHTTRDSCWVIIDGQVYDATSILDTHPGGATVLLKNSGKDATYECTEFSHEQCSSDTWFSPLKQSICTYSPTWHALKPAHRGSCRICRPRNTSQRRNWTDRGGETSCRCTSEATFSGRCSESTRYLGEHSFYLSSRNNLKRAHKTLCTYFPHAEVRGTGSYLNGMGLLSLGWRRQL